MLPALESCVHAFTSVVTSRLSVVPVKVLSEWKRVVFGFTAAGSLPAMGRERGGGMKTVIAATRVLFTSSASSGPGRSVGGVVEDTGRGEIDTSLAALALGRSSSVAQSYRSTVRL